MRKALILFMLAPSSLTAFLTGGCLSPQIRSFSARALTAPVQYQMFNHLIYAANSEAGSISTYTFDPAQGVLFSGPIVAAGIQPSWLAAHPGGRWLYVANQGSASVSAYRIDPESGDLSLIGDAPADEGSRFPIVHPSGNFLYVANARSATVSVYHIDRASGALTRIQTALAGASRGSEARALALDPSGAYLYALTRQALANSRGKSEIAAYWIDPETGFLFSRKRVRANFRAENLSIDRGGKFLYAANEDDNEVQMFRIDKDGEILESDRFEGGRTPGQIAIHPSNRFAYALNRSSHDVSEYARNESTGELSPIGTIGAGRSPSAMAFDVDGQFAFVANHDSGSVSVYGVDPRTGALSRLSEAPAESGVDCVVAVRVEKWVTQEEESSE